MKLAAIVIAGALGSWAADVERGAAVARENNCFVCHSARGVGGRTASDFARPRRERYTPAALASALWNHSAQQWAVIRGRAARPPLNEADSEALFAYLYAARFTEAAGSSRRGEEIFKKKGCEGCHEIAGWSSVPSDPLGLAQQMWNHSSIMTATAVETSKERPTVTAQDLADIAAYAREARGLPPPPATPPIPPDLEEVRLAGKQYFDANCLGCHRLGLALDRRLANRTYLSIAAGLWNHLPKMIVVPTPAASQMRATIAYVWELQYLGPAGNRVNGARVFERKNCGQCHIDPKTGASTILRGEKLLTPFSMIALGWKHERQAAAPGRGIRWSSLSPEDIADVIAYLNSRP